MDALPSSPTAYYTFGTPLEIDNLEEVDISSSQMEENNTDDVRFKLSRHTITIPDQSNFDHFLISEIADIDSYSYNGEFHDDCEPLVGIPTERDQTITKKITSFFANEDFETLTTGKAIEKLLNQNKKSSQPEIHSKTTAGFYLCENWKKIPKCPDPKIQYMTEIYTDVRCLKYFKTSATLPAKYDSAPAYCNLTLPTDSECNDIFKFRNDSFVDRLPDYVKTAFCSELETVELAKLAKGEKSFYDSVEPKTLANNHYLLAFSISMSALSLLATCKEELPTIFRSHHKNKAVPMIKIIAQSALLLAPIVSMAMMPVESSTSAASVVTGILGASGSGLNAAATVSDLCYALKRYKETEFNEADTQHNHGLTEIVRNVVKLTTSSTQCALQLTDLAGHLPVHTRASLYIACFTVNTLQLSAKAVMLCSRRVTPCLQSCINSINTCIPDTRLLRTPTINQLPGIPSVFHRVSNPHFV